MLESESTERLSERQRYIASLAAEGLSSKEIAGRLHLSVRTVDNQLAHVYTALGVRGRTELSAALGLRPGDSTGGTS